MEKLSIQKQIEPDNSNIDSINIHDGSKTVANARKNMVLLGFGTPLNEGEFDGNKTGNIPKIDGQTRVVEFKHL